MIIAHSFIYSLIDSSIYLLISGFDAWVSSHSDTKNTDKDKDKDKDKDDDRDYDDPYNQNDDDNMNVYVDTEIEVKTVKEEKRKAKPVAGKLHRLLADNSLFMSNKSIFLTNFYDVSLTSPIMYYLFAMLFYFRWIPLTHAHTHSHTHAYIYTCLNKHTGIQTQTHTHAHTHTHMHTHTHIRTYTHTQNPTVYSIITIHYSTKLIHSTQSGPQRDQKSRSNHSGEK